MTLRDRIEEARRAQQVHEQKHDVQLEISGDGMECDACGKPLWGGPLQHLPHDVAGCSAIWVDQEADVSDHLRHSKKV